MLDRTSPPVLRSWLFPEMAGHRHVPAFPMSSSTKKLQNPKRAFQKVSLRLKCKKITMQPLLAYTKQNHRDQTDPFNSILLLCLFLPLLLRLLLLLLLLLPLLLFGLTYVRSTAASKRHWAHTHPALSRSSRRLVPSAITQCDCTKSLQQSKDQAQARQSPVLVFGWR